MTDVAPIALVTGGARRVGRAICLELARSGYEVWVHYGTAANEATSLRDHIARGGRRCQLFCADLGQRSSQDAFIADVLNHLGPRRLSLAVMNASVFESEPLAQLEDATLDRAFELHSLFPLRLVRALAPKMKQGDPSLIALMLDAALSRPPRNLVHYHASKGALASLVPSLCRELAPHVRVVGICPGQVCWPEDYDEEKRRALTNRIPQGRVGTPEEVARLVRFVATEGTYINGVEIIVDGGASTVGIDRA